MREIKFKGYYKMNNSIIECDPDYIDVDGKCFERMWEDMDEDGNYILCQYIGLEDKNGKKIYESDLIEDNVGVGSVEYSNGAYRVDYRNGSYKWFIDFLDSEKRQLEVIGNIYEKK